MKCENSRGTDSTIGFKSSLYEEATRRDVVRGITVTIYPGLVCGDIVLVGGQLFAKTDSDDGEREKERKGSWVEAHICTGLLNLC